MIEWRLSFVGPLGREVYGSGDVRLLFVRLLGRGDGRGVDRKMGDVVLFRQSRRLFLFFLGNRGLRDFDVGASVFHFLGFALGLLPFGSALFDPAHAAGIVIVVAKSGSIRAVLDDLPSRTHRRIRVRFVGSHPAIAPLNELGFRRADIGKRICRRPRVRPLSAVHPAVEHVHTGLGGGVLFAGQWRGL